MTLYIHMKVHLALIDIMYSVIYYSSFAYFNLLYSFSLFLNGAISQETGFAPRKGIVIDYSSKSTVLDSYRTWSWILAFPSSFYTVRLAEGAVPS